ncbi:MAG: hypothetical protein KKF12_17575 [Proteobacteria bacterium]|nr:hypothetical protein [Desulfobacula sp.]MBU0971017.1 hypothetical protein [Pseudomonadota bacterium]MBU3953150.1 hypothetical protein [Pseudomonadota bacterium]MBU4132630.1 hypothetical protein [Pseudomonadota bacterium]
MEPATVLAAPHFLKILEMILGLGPIGLVLIVWYFDKQKTDEILRQYTKDMQEQREQYLTNVSLVKKYADLAGDLKEIITLNTQTMTRLVDRIDKEVCR